MRVRAVIIVVLVGLGLITAGITWFLGRDTIEAVNIERALEDAASAEGAGLAGDGGEAASSDSEVVTDATGSWVVDTDVVTFDAVTGAGSWVGYRIDEELRGIGDYTAVGRSPRVDGEVMIDGSVVVTATIRADLQGLVSDDSNRDARVRPLFADRPVVFTLRERVDFGSVPSEGQRVAVSAQGTLRIGSVERDVEVELSADVAGPRLIITGTTLVRLEDFDIAVPSAARVLSVSDEATIELQLFLARS